MKHFIPAIALVLFFSACDNTKIQLRAPEPQTTDSQPVNSVKDSIKTDTTKLALKDEG